MGGFSSISTAARRVTKRETPTIYPDHATSVAARTHSMLSPTLNTANGEHSRPPTGASSAPSTNAGTSAPPENTAGIPLSVPEAPSTSDIFEHFAIYTEKCRIRDYDYNDPIVLKEYFSGEIAHCKPDAKPFVFRPEMNLTGGFSCIGFDAEISRLHYNATTEDWKCIYKECIRGERYQIIDGHFDYGATRAFVPGDCPPYEYLWIECILEKQNIRNYSQPLLLPVVKPAKKNIRRNNLRRKPLNVLVLGMDSVSRLNAHRQFPETLKFLQTKKNLVELFGFNKIGVNSAPNQIPLVTGIKYLGDNLQARVTNKYFDNETRYLWDDYESRGYRTMFFEEQWKYGLFIYPSTHGFKEVPTTYWPRPLIQAVDWSDLKRDGYEWCIGTDFPAKYYLEYTSNMFRMLGSDRPLFSYSWLSEIAHNDLNGGIRADGYFLDFFKNMDKHGLLDTTAIFFISDHGFRFGYFRQTELGRYEDMLPYGFILMPDSYYEQYPEALTNVRTNARRLVTVYDLHVTMLELADAWDEDRVVRTPNGYSLFSTVIPENRTCLDAGISFQFCSCFESHPYDVGGPLALEVARFVIDTINEIVRNNSATEKCSYWELNAIETFSQLSEGNHWTNFFKISIKTKPVAQFEAAVELLSNKSWTLLSEIDRTDWFSSHAGCAKSTDYERYCYCKNS
ncbi:uncharacterized protein LOC100904315 [Galendromus occidentalis]|uniref:Uncharacterized protein LOC100904315 n=1 Tax=Galendromus occidentalis TaxID=34638 RepID=A0AAJ6VWU5_9ACAR|nr:uncharacterized protein LOC100904315 [Galendromus occidentalis]